MLTIIIFRIEKCLEQWRLMQKKITIYKKKQDERDSRKTGHIDNFDQFFRISFSRWRQISSALKECTLKHSIYEKWSFREKKRPGNGEKDRYWRERGCSRLA